MYKPNKLYRYLTIRYSLAVFLIFLTSSAAYFSLNYALSESENIALVVNKSGYQRMLSQRIALKVVSYQSAYKKGDQSKINSIQSEFNELAAIMEEDNKTLASGSFFYSGFFPPTSEFRKIYFEDKNLYIRVERYIEKSRQYFKNFKDSNFIDNSTEIVTIANELLPILDQAVKQYQLEGEERLRKIKEMERGNWLFTLVILLIEVFFIFRPMVNSAVDAHSAEQKIQENLENLVELRTLELNLANNKLKEIAHKDVLTGLLNRLTLEDDIRNLTMGYELNSIDFAVVMIDIDWFKEINDTYGHQCGDSVLVQISELFLISFRQSDKIYRTGGEEFVILLNRLTLDEVFDKMEDVREDVKKSDFKYEDKSIHITISIGIYHSSCSSKLKVHDIILMADHALYQSKRSGRNCTTIFNGEEV